MGCAINLPPWKAATGPATRPAQGAPIKCKVEFPGDFILEGLSTGIRNVIVGKPNLTDTRLILWSKVTDKREVLIQDDRLEALVPASVWQGRDHIVVLLRGRYKGSREDTRPLWLFDSATRKLVKLDILNPQPEKGQRFATGCEVAGLDPTCQKAYVQVTLAIFPDISSSKSVPAPGSGLFAVDLDTGVTSRIAGFGYVSTDGKTLLEDVNVGMKWGRKTNEAFDSAPMDIEVVDIATGVKQVRQMNRLEVLLKYPRANHQEWPMVNPKDPTDLITMLGSTVIDLGPINAHEKIFLRDDAGAERLLQVTYSGKTSLRMLDLCSPQRDSITICQFADSIKFGQGAILANGVLLAPGEAIPMRMRSPTWAKGLMLVLRGSGKTYDMVSPGATSQSVVLPSDTANPKCFVTWGNSADGIPVPLLATVELDGVRLSPLEVPAEISGKRPTYFYLRRGRLRCMFRQDGVMKFADLLFKPPNEW
jgi:hypothetical protein